MKSMIEEAENQLISMTEKMKIEVISLIKYLVIIYFILYLYICFYFSTIMKWN